MINNKGDIWISAVLYIGLGVILLSIILAVGLPAVNKIRDKNVAIDTENLMSTLDRDIRAVYSEGVGSKRPFQFEVKKGNLIVDDANEIIRWQFETTALLSEPDILINKGNLQLLTQQGTDTKSYLSTFQLNYSGILDLKLTTSNNQFTGANNLIIMNSGSQGSSKTVITITPI